MQLGFEEADRLAEHQPVLRAAEGENVNSGVDAGRAQIGAESGGGVREARAVEMNDQAAIVRETAELAQLFDFVESAELRGLRDREHSRLREVDDALGVQIGLEIGRAEFAVGRCDGNDLRTGKAFECAAFVALQVRRYRSQDGLPGTQQRTERRDVCARAVEREKDFDVLAEVLAEARARTRRPLVVTVGRGVARIRFDDRFEDLGRNRRVVVAGKTATERLAHCADLCASRRVGPYRLA